MPGKCRCRALIPHSLRQPPPRAKKRGAWLSPPRSMVPDDDWPIRQPLSRTRCKGI
jgi:hypothetical protein